MKPDNDNSPQSTAPQAFAQYPVYYDHRPDDEIDLFELLELFWRRKYFIVAITALFAAVALVYVFVLATPTFTITAKVSPPSTVDIKAVIQYQQKLEMLLNQSIPPSEAITEDSVFDTFVAAVNSLDTKKSAYLATFGARELADTTNTETPTGKAQAADNPINKFLKNLAINTAPTDRKNVPIPSSVTISLKTAQPGTGAAFINNLTASANALAAHTLEQARLDMVDSHIERLQHNLNELLASEKRKDALTIRQLEEQNQLRREEIQAEIKELLIEADKRHQYQLEDIKEALAIAQKLGLNDPFEPALGSETGIKDQPLYLRGIQFLTAELQALETRDSRSFVAGKLLGLERELQLLNQSPRIEALKARSDYFAITPGAETLQRQIEQLEALREQPLNNIAVMRVDTPPLVPTAPTTPRRRLIVAASVLGGGFMAILLVLILNMRDERRKNTASP